MRTLFITALFLAACSGAAQSETRYDLYIFQARDGGAKIYAFAGGNAAAALEVRGCGDVELLPNAAAVASEISARRRAPDVGVVTIEARGSRVEFDDCGVQEEGDNVHVNDEDSLVVIENASARQMRRMVQSLDAAPAPVREEIIATLGLS